MPITLEMGRRHDTPARRVFYLCVAVMALWLAWGVLYEATGFPGVNYLSFGLVSLPCGAVLFLASVIAYAHGSQEDHAKADAVAALLGSVAVALVPFVAMLALIEDYS